MVKKTEVWKNEYGNIFDTKEEALEDELRQDIINEHPITEEELDSVVYILEDERKVKLLSAYMSARKAVQAMREKQEGMQS